MSKFALDSWDKIGLIRLPKSNLEWINSHAYIPTPILLDNDIIRIFVAFWDKDLVGRIGFIDVSSKNPTEIIRFSEKPSLDVGTPGTFDDKGVSPLSIVRKGDILYLFYAGWQRVDTVRYLLFTGLATSNNNGETFIRAKQTPILDRTDSEFLVRSGACVIYDTESGLWKMIYAGGSENFDMKGKLVPSYSFRYLETKDPYNWPTESKLAISPDVTKKEFGFGRPFVLKGKEGYKMLYSIRKLDKGYEIGYAESMDMINWERMDARLLDFNTSPYFYDNQSRFAPWILTAKDGDVFLFYNGNDYGREGVCLAKLAEKRRNHL